MAQYPQLVTDFEQSGKGIAYPIQKLSLNDLQVVMLQDPNCAVVTHGMVKPDNQAIYGGGDPNNLPSTEESFVASFAGFGGANGSTQFMDVRFQWLNPADPNRWVLIETLQSPQLGDPSLHLGGKVRIWVNLPNCAQYEFTDPNLGPVTPEIGVALLISETGKNVPQGFQDNAVLSGSFEFVGVSSVADPNTPNPKPVPTRFIPITDPGCTGATSDPNTGNWRLIEFNLPTESVIGWTYRGGNGVLDATGVGDGVNRGVLAGLVLAVRHTDTTSGYVEFLVDQITFEAPVTDPASAPAIAAPAIAGNANVEIDGVVSRATNVTLEICRFNPSDPNNALPFVATDSYSWAPGLSPTSELHLTNTTVSPPLGVGDRLRARQSVGADVGPYSIIVTVNPPAAFSATLSLDETGSLGTVADFEWVGASAVVGTSGTQGHPVYPLDGRWQKLEYSLIPGVEPVISFAGGNGLLQPHGGLYNIDAMFFTIDSTSPSVGPYVIYVDHIYYIDPNNNEVLIADAEVSNPFPNVRGQSTATGTSTALSSVTSYDGISSNRLGWSFPNTNADNTFAPYRPPVTFPDSAKAVGMWLLVEDPRTSTLSTPVIEPNTQRVIGVPSAVKVGNIDPNATIVRLFVDGALSNSVNPAGATSVNITPGSPLSAGKQITANYDVASRATSDYAYPRVVQKPPAPTLPTSLVAGQSTVTVSNILNSGNSVASQVRVLANGTQIGTANPAGAASVVVNVNPALVAGQQITARQTINTLESVDSVAIAVGTGVHLRVVINEFMPDNTGTDVREFIELYNAEPNAVNISGWVVRQSDATAPPLDTLADYTIPASTTLASHGYYVMGHAIVPNVNQVLGTGNLFSDGTSATQLLDQNGVVVDTLIKRRWGGTLGVGDVEGYFWGSFQSQNAAPQSMARWFDGFDTDDNGRDFGIQAQTPGTSNNLPSLAPYYENCDGGTVGAVVPNWSGSYVLPRYIDPTVVSTYNLNVIPASPQGGKAMTVVDTSGGGDAGALNDAARFGYDFSCYVYIDTGNPGFVAGGSTPNEWESWSVGMGCVDQLHNVFQPVGSANGNTGLIWQFLATENADTGQIGSITFQLVNRGHGGGTAGTVLIDVPPASLTTGWHRIRITRNYENVSAAYDETLTYSGTIANLGPGVLQMGYREGVTGFPSTLRPPTIDDISITVPAAPALGACCIPAGCQVLTNAVCVAFGGDYAGNGTNCSTTTCPLTGACCKTAGCSIDSNSNCTATGGTFRGVGTACTPNPCFCRADTNCDAVISFADINPFVQAVGNLSAWQAAHPSCPWQNCDVNGDGVVSFADINPFVQKLSSPGPCQ